MGGGNGIMDELIKEEKALYCSYAKALTILKKGAIYNITGNDYDTLEWHKDNTLSKPTKDQLDNEVTRLTSEWESKQINVGMKRAVEYPKLADFADAMYWSSKGDDSKLTAYYKACEDVKTKYPKA